MQSKRQLLIHLVHITVAYKKLIKRNFNRTELNNSKLTIIPSMID